jgi:hypothetical protein
MPGNYPPIDPVACGAPAANTNNTRVTMNNTNLICEATFVETKKNLLESVFMIFSFFDCVYRLWQHTGYKTGYKTGYYFWIFPPLHLKQNYRGVVSGDKS